MRFFLSGMSDDELIFNLFYVTPFVILVWMWMQRSLSTQLTQGPQRRAVFQLDSRAHPKPSISWKHDRRIRYNQGLVSVESVEIWWQFFSTFGSDSKEYIVIYHGYGDHSDYILHEIAHDLALKTGKGVIVFDQPGFGRSDGLWGYIPNWFDHVMLCVAATRSIVKSVSGKSRVSLIGYGHSMGGGLLITAAIQYPRLFSALILSAPMCGLSPSLRKHFLIEKFFFLLADLVPTAPIAPVPDLGALCFEDPSFYNYTKQTNPLGYRGKPRLGTARSLLLAQQWLSENGHRLSTPFLILHGTRDMITSLDSSVDLYRKAISTDKTIEILEGYFHSILGPGQSVEKSQKAFSLVVDWIRQRF